MKEHLPSHESPEREVVPKLPYGDLRQLVAAYCGYTDPDATVIEMKHTLGESLNHLLQTMKSIHPSVVSRGSKLAGRINQGIASSNEPLCPDIKNFMNCYIIAYGLMSESYRLTGRQMPADTHQQPWFEQPQMITVDNIFDGLNMAQLQITEHYPDFVAAIREYVNLTWSDHNTAFSTGLTAVAAAEIYDAFEQMERCTEAQ
jgi:hypothetical protein